MNPTHEQIIVSVTDPAVDRTVAGYDAQLAAYAEKRTHEALARVRFTGTVTAFRLRPLGVEARADVLSQPSEARQLLRATRAGLVSWFEGCTVNGDGSLVLGTEHTLKLTDGAAFPLAAADDLDALFREWGGGWLDEIGAVVRDRATFHPRRSGPFSLPRSSAQAAT